MQKIIIVSHGDLAKGLKNSLEMIAGKNEHVYALSMNPDENPDDVAAKFEVIYKNNTNPNDSYLIASDIPGGSVNTVMMNFLNLKNVYLVSGVNLVFLLEYLFSNEQTVPEAIDKAILTSKEALRELKLESTKSEEENFWE